MAHSNQGGVKNYLGKQKMVKAPLHWQSAPNHPTTELAYITKKEKDLLLKKDLHKSLKGGVNRGPSGIMSLNGWGDAPSGSPGQRSGPETGKSHGDQEKVGRSVSTTVGSPHGNRTVTSRTKTVSPKDHFEQSWSGPKGWFGGGGYRNLNVAGDTSQGHKSRFGGLGGLLRGALGIFGGIPGKVLSGIIGAKNWAKNKALSFGEEVDEFGNYPTLDRYLNRKTDKYKDKPYLGQGQSNYSFDGPTEGNDLGLAVNRQNAPIGPGLRVGQDLRMSNTMPNNLSANLGANNFNTNTDLFDPSHVSQLIANKTALNTAPSFQDGGRAGYAFGRGPVLDIQEDENTLDFMNDQGIPHGEMAETSPFEMRIQELMDTGMSWQEAYQIASEEFGQIAEGESDQGIASIV